VLVTTGRADISEVSRAGQRGRQVLQPGEAHLPAARAILEGSKTVGLGTSASARPTYHAVRRRAASGQDRHPQGEKGGVLILDARPSGLHLADVEELLALLGPARRCGGSRVSSSSSTTRPVMAPAD